MKGARVEKILAPYFYKPLTPAPTRSMKRYLTIILLIYIPLIAGAQIPHQTAQTETEQLQKQLEQEPDNLDLHYKYALSCLTTNLQTAINVMRQYKNKHPQTDVQELIGNLYYLASKYEKAIMEWNHAKIEEMHIDNLERYAMSNYYIGRFNDGLDIAEKALESHPHSVSLTRIAMMCSAEAGSFKDALIYGKELFSHKDTTRYYDVDHFYYGRAFDYNIQYREAIKQYQLALALKGDYRLIDHNVIKKEMLQSYANLANIYMEQADEADDDEKNDAYKKADDIYREIIQALPEATEYATFMRAKVHAYMDIDQLRALALPYYQKVISMISPKKDKSDTDVIRLTEAYKYMISYYINIKDNKDTAMDYAMKLYEIDPENAFVKKLLDI